MHVMNDVCRTSGEQQALAALLDDQTRLRVTMLRPVAGTRCLTVGAGAVSIANWLADRTGPGGVVVATGVNPQPVPAHPRLRAHQMELSGVEQWPSILDGPFDLIVTRDLLAHLPLRQWVLHQLTQRLAPAGVVLVEDFACWPGAGVVAALTREAATIYTAYQEAVTTVLHQTGTDHNWARQAHTALRQENLTAVETRVHTSYWHGNTPGTRLIAGTARRLRPQLLAAGLTAGQLDLLFDLLVDRQLVVHGQPLYSTSGRRLGPR